MPPAPKPANEAERLVALRSYAILDTEFEKRFDDLARLAGRLTDMPISLISLVDEDRQWFKAKEGLEVRETPRDQAFCGYALLSDRSLVVQDATHDERFADNALVTGQPGVRFYAGFPLIDRDGYTLGTLCVLDIKPRDLTDAQRELLTGLSMSVITALELHRAMRNLQELAMTDALTGLPNRVAFNDRLERAIADLRLHQHPFTILSLDCDGFKRINDTQGHAAGDAVLRAVSTAMRSHVRQNDLAARLAGDEFALIVHDHGEPTMAVADRICNAIAAARTDTGLQVTASVGAVRVVGAPPDGDTVLRLADRCLYEAKAGGRNRVVMATYPSY